MNPSGMSKLWMGDLETYMDENFLQTAFLAMGEHVHNIKLIKQKGTGQNAGYCFVEFPDSDTARRAMLRLNGKIVPGTRPPRRFKLNEASYGREHLNTPELSLFVGDLSDDVDDLALYTLFSQKYTSVRSAKIVLNARGQSKGFGFVRFMEEPELQKALVEMDRYVGLGLKPIRCSNAQPRKPGTRNPAGPAKSQAFGDPAPYNPSYYTQMYPGYHYGGYWSQNPTYPSYYQGYMQHPGAEYTMEDLPPQEPFNEANAEDDEELEDPELEIDVAVANKKFMEQSEELYTALEGSRWHPLDYVLSPINPQVAS